MGGRIKIFYILLNEIDISSGQVVQFTEANCQNTELPGMGVTKAPFANFSITGNFDLAKV